MYWKCIITSSIAKDHCLFSQYKFDTYLDTSWLSPCDLTATKLCLRAAGSGGFSLLLSSVLKSSFLFLGGFFAAYLNIFVALPQVFLHTSQFTTSLITAMKYLQMTLLFLSAVTCQIKF